MGTLTLYLVAALLSGIVTASPQKHYLDRTSEEVDSDEYGQFKGAKGTNCTCGTTNKAKTRIVGGKAAKVNEYPHMAAVARVHKGKYFDVFCGSTIISEHHALTAAHCTVDEEEPLGILAGAHDISKVLETKTLVYMVDSTIEHEKYNPETFEYDIALLVFKQPIKFSEKVGRACLPTSPMNSFLVDKYVKISGWGDTAHDGEQSKTLLKVNLRVVPLEQCAMRYRQNPITLKNPIQFCTYGHDRDSCQGDSGGPVTWLDPETNRYTLVGVVSFGRGCGSTSPGVNSDVYAFLPWITGKMRASSPGAFNTCVKVG